MPHRTVPTVTDRPVYARKAELFKALGHPVRIRTLEMLVDGERPVSSILADTGAEASQLSQHLAVLRRAGVVTARRKGNAVVYTLAHPSFGDMLTAARTALNDSLARTRDELADLANDTLPDEDPRA